MDSVNSSVASHIFHPFYNQNAFYKVNGCTDVLKRIGLVALNILIFLTTLGIAHTVYYCMENHVEAIKSNAINQSSDKEDYGDIETSDSKTDNVLSSSLFSDQQESIGDQTHAQVKKIKSNFISEDNLKEVERLNNALDSATKTRLDKQYVTSALSPDEEKEDCARLIFGRALEIKNAVMDKNYVFFHGFTLHLLMMTYLNDELMRFVNNGEKHSGFHYLRFPFSITEMKKDNLQDVDDHKLRADLLSVDAYLFNDDKAESNSSLLLNNVSMHDGDGVIEEYVQEVLKIINPNFDFYDPEYLDLITSFKAHCNLLSYEPVGGLYVICVPKEIMQDKERSVGYRSHPFGMECDCYSKEDEIKILEELQNDKVTPCVLGDKQQYHFNPQYRLYAKELSPDPSVGVRIYLISHLGKERKKVIKEEVARIAKGFLKIAQPDNPSL